jgi:hypothetical protein
MVTTRNMMTRRTTTMTTLLFDITTNLVVGCIPGRERGEVISTITMKKMKMQEEGQGRQGTTTRDKD